MNKIQELIQSKLALRIAQLELDNATLQAQIEQLQKQLEENKGE
ncbi:hypothetical protein Si128_00305 [Streptococcus infantarius subsp. infantarius]|nr:hypothetical protein [Streptococcus infantarius subsp. infantarius]